MSVTKTELIALIDNMAGSLISAHDLIYQDTDLSHAIGKDIESDVDCFICPVIKEAEEITKQPLTNGDESDTLKVRKREQRRMTMLIKRILYTDWDKAQADMKQANEMGFDSYMIYSPNEKG